MASCKECTRNGRDEVSKAELNRHLSWLRCADCGTWLLTDANHQWPDYQRLRATHGLPVSVSDGKEPGTA